MRPFKMTMLAAAAAAALAATAVVALPAIGDSGSTGTDQTPDVGDLAACLAKHGLPGAPTTAAQLKPWLASQDPGTVQTAMDACQSSAPDTGASGPDAATMIACVRSHGIDAPMAPADFKRWLGEQQPGRSKELDDALVACKISQAPQDKGDAQGKSDCSAPTDKSPGATPKKRAGTTT